MPAFDAVTLHTARLNLRWLTESDAPAHFAMHAHPDVMRYWSGPRWTGIAQAEQAIAHIRRRYESGDAICFGIELAATRELIGNCSLYHLQAANRRCELGFILAREHWGNGYIGEALAALLDYGFGALNLNRIEADVDPRNGASIRVLTQLKFHKEGYMRERWLVNGEVCDTEFFGLLRRDWQK